MNNQDQAAKKKLQDLIDEDQLSQLLEYLLLERLENSSLTDKQEPQLIACQQSSRYSKLILSRKSLTIVAGIILLCCLRITFVPVFSQNSFSWPDLITSSLSIICGLTLVILIVTELIVGAGSELECELQQDGKKLFEYQFIPSINQLHFLLLFLFLGFLTVIVGFSSLYAEMFRSNPEHFWGLKDGLLSIYFSVITFSTVGYGDIHPVSLLAKTVVMAEVFIAMFFSLVALSITLSWVASHEKQKQENSLRQRIEERKKERRSLLLVDLLEGKNLKKADHQNGSV
ncbi:MAG: potassium channel family protein [Spirulinaceae cyanobacterium]